MSTEKDRLLRSAECSELLAENARLHDALTRILGADDRAGNYCKAVASNALNPPRSFRDAPKRRGDWMQTFTGKAFWPMDAHVEDIDPDDIAHALGMICRYGGHVSDFYSVAEHCVLMSHAVSPENALWALLHDSTEAYLIDLPRPLKRSLPGYRVAEDALMLVICERFGLDPVMPDEIKAADNRILRDERAAYMGPPPMPWASIESVEPLGVQIMGYQPAEATEAWINRFCDLTGLYPPTWGLAL